MEKNEPNQNKYDAALAKYNTQLDDTEVAAQVAKIIAEKVPGNHTEEVKKFLFHCIDLTTLNTTDSDESVMKFLYPIHVFGRRFHKDIYRETTTRCNPGSCLCNVPGY